MLIIKNSKKQDGFVLAELIVAIFIFTIVMVMSMGALVSLIDANRKTQSLKSVMNNLNIAVDLMSRTIIVSTNYWTTDEGFNCISDNSFSGTSYIIFLSNLDLDGVNGFNDYVHYKLVVDNLSNCTGYIARLINNSPVPVPVPDNSQFVRVTAPEARIEGLNFELVGETSGDTVQPKVIINVKGYAGNKSTVKTAFNIQTTVSQRLLDLLYLE